MAQKSGWSRGGTPHPLGYSYDTYTSWGLGPQLPLDEVLEALDQIDEGHAEAAVQSLQPEGN